LNRLTHPEGGTLVSPSAVTHLVEYFRLSIAEDERQAINRWAGQFLRAREAGLLDHCRQLLRGVKATGLDLSLRSQAVVVHCQALLAALLDERDEAEADYQRSLDLFHQAGDEVGVAWVLNDLGTLHQARGEWSQAVDCYREALARLLPSRRGRSDEAMVRNNLGLALVTLGQYSEGITELEQAAALYRQLGQPQGEARVKVNLGQLYHRQGDVSRAMEAYQDALQTLHELGDRRVEVEVLNSLGVLYRRLGQFDRAIEYYEQSLSLAQTLNDLSGQAQALGNLGAAYQLRGDRAQARICYQEALALYEMLDDRQGQAQMWGNLGHLLSFENRDQEALGSYQRGLDLYREIHDPAGEVTALINVAGAYRDMERYDEADVLYQESLAIGRRLGNIRLQDKALGALGMLRLLQERWNEAEVLLREALALQQQRGDVYAQVETLYKLGRLAYKRGQYDQVLSILEPAWQMAQEHGYGRWLVVMAWLIGDAAFAQADPSALNYYATAVIVASQYQDQERFRAGLAVLGDYVDDLVRQGKREAALEVCQHLIELWQREEWQSWTETAIAYVKVMAEAIRAGQPLPVALDIGRDQSEQSR